jgi:hypothetical protein
MDAQQKRAVQYEVKTILSYLRKNESAGMNHFSEITSHIFVCNNKYPDNVPLLCSYKIRNVINVSGKEQKYEIEELYKRKKIKVHNMTSKDYDLSYDVIHDSVKNAKKILIYCETGSDNSIVLVLNYLLRRYYTLNYKVNENLIDFSFYYLISILKFVKNARLCANPTPQQVYDLIIQEFKYKKLFEPLGLTHFAKQKIKMVEPKPREDSEDSSVAYGFNNKSDEESSIDIFNT